MVHMKELLEGSPKRYRPRWSEKNSMRYIGLIVCPFFCLVGSGGDRTCPLLSPSLSPTGTKEGQSPCRTGGRSAEIGDIRPPTP